MTMTSKQTIPYSLTLRLITRTVICGGRIVTNRPCPLLALVLRVLKSSLLDRRVQLANMFFVPCLSWGNQLHPVVGRKLNQFLLLTDLRFARRGFRRFPHVVLGGLRRGRKSNLATTSLTQNRTTLVTVQPPVGRHVLCRDRVLADRKQVKVATLKSLPLVLTHMPQTKSRDQLLPIPACLQPDLPTQLLQELVRPDLRIL